MKKAWFWLEMLFAVAALAIVCLFFTYAWPDERYGLSGWVQAIGSIASVWGAFAIVYIQNRHAKRQHAINIAQAQRDKIGGILAIAEHARNLVQKLAIEFMVDLGMARPFRDLIYPQFRNQIGRALTSLQAIPLHDINSHKVVVALQDLDGLVENALRSLDSLCEYDANSITFEKRYQLYGHLFVDYLQDADFALKRIGEAQDEVPTWDDG